jgi:hypothetical protein
MDPYWDFDIASSNAAIDVPKSDIPPLKSENAPVVDSNKTKYIAGGVIAALVLIAIIVAAVVLTRPHGPPAPTPTATPTHHFPVIIAPITVSQAFKIQVQLGGVTPVSCVVYFDSGIVGIVLSANNVVDDFSCLTVASGVVATSKDFPISVGYSAYDTKNGATFNTSTQFVNTFQLDLKTCTVNNHTQLTNIPNNKFNQDLYIVSTQNAQVIVASLVLASTQQTYNLIGFEQNGTSLPNLTIPNGIAVASEYSLLASSLQSFFGVLIFDETNSLVYDLIYTTTTTSVFTFSFSGTFVAAACTQTTATLIIAVSNTLYLYTRDIKSARPTFQLQDFLTFQFILKSSALDASGQLFALGTDQKATVIGKISGNLFGELRMISIVGQPVTLTNTNGVCGIQSDSSAHVYVFQSDTVQNAAVFQVAAF